MSHHVPATPCSSWSLTRGPGGTKHVPAWAANVWGHSMRAVALALSLLLPGGDPRATGTAGHYLPGRALCQAPGPGAWQCPAELQGIQAEATPGVEQGLKFWCTLSGCQQTATMARMPPAHCTSCPHKDWPPPAQLSPETAQLWAGSVGRAGRQEGGKTTTNKPARPVTEKGAGGSGLKARLPRGQEEILGTRATCPDGLSCPSPGATSLSWGLRAPQPPNIPVSSFICCLLLN